MKMLETARLVIRNWEDRDRDLFHEINSDERVMEFFPFRRSRAETDALLDRLRDDIGRNGFGFCALELKVTREAVGFAGLNRTDVVPGLPGAMEIGWRLAFRHWGNGYATEAARELLAFGFRDLGLERVVSFAVAGNFRSTAVMERLGMIRDATHDFDHPGVPDTRPELSRHVFYRIDRSASEGAGREARSRPF